MEKQEELKRRYSDLPRTPLAFFLYVSKPKKWWAIGAIIAVIFASATSQGTNYFFKLIVDAVEAKDYDAVLLFALLYPVAEFLVQLLYRLSAYFGRNWSSNSRKYTYDQMTAYTLGHSHSYFMNRFAGSVMSKISNVVTGIDTLIPDILWTHINSAVAFIITFVFIIKASLLAGATFAALVVMLFYLNKKMAPKKAELSRLNADSKTELSGKIIDVFSNIQAVRQYSRRHNEQTEIESVSSRVRDAHYNNWGYTELMLFWNGVVLFIFSFAMFWFLTQSWRSGEMGTGDFVLIISLYAQITGTLIFIGRAFNSTAQAVGEMREGLDDLLLPHEILDKADAEPLVAKKAEINWNNVSFLFDGKPVFTDFNLKIPAGQRLGLVGQSGAGKTTFVSLLLRQHEIEAGSIEIDRQDIAHVTQDSLRSSIAVVPQEPALFHRSIKDNILYGKPGATEAEVIEVAKKAQAHDFISELPEGYNTMVGERGIKLSGGQKQRIAIARAMLKDAPILVLDEATSALDSESEVEIQLALETLMEGRTVIAIAHRLSTLRKMDRIIVLETGKIVEDGDHETLSKAGGIYQRLWNHQAGGFLLD